MAQESRLIAFEQALKDEGIKGTNLEPVARSIFQQESSSGANVKTSNAGARGPMQVLPATFKAYNPQGNIDNPYDNSVGGLRYIKDLYSKTNDPGLTAVGYYGGPKAIEKAKKGIAVSDPRNPNAPNTLQYMEQVMGRTKGAPAGKQQRPAVPKTIRQVAPELGPNYQAALALMAKADDLSEARERIAQEEEDNTPADFSQARNMLAQIKPVTGFVAQEPRRMNKGGEVQQTPYTPRAFIPDAVKYQGLTADNPNLKADFKPLNFDRLIQSGAMRVTKQGLPDGSFNPDPNAGFSLVSAYNDRAGQSSKNWQDNPQAYEIVRRMAAERPEDMGAYKYLQIVESAKDLGLKDEDIFLQQEPRRMASGGEVTNPVHGVKGFKEGGPVFVDDGSSTDKYGNPVQPLPYGFKPPKGPAGTALVTWVNSRTGEKFVAPSGGYTNDNPDWTTNPFQVIQPNVPSTPPQTPQYGQPSPPPPTPSAPAAPPIQRPTQGISYQEAFINRPTPAYGEPRVTPSPTYQPPPSSTPRRAPVEQKYNRSDMYTFLNKKSRLMAHGGEVQGYAEGGEAKKESPSMGERVKGTAKEILRSMQYAPYDLLGAPVDVINLGLKGVDYVTGSKLATEKPVGGSEYLIQKSRELGIADEPTGSTTETLTRLGTGIVSPTAGPRAVVAAGKAVKGTAKAALEDLAMAGTGQGGSKLAQKIMEPGTAFAVRPKGGVFLGAKSIDEPPLTNFDIQLRRFTEDLNRTDPQQEAVVDFLDKKFRNYVSKDMGTADDPVFKKMLLGEIPNHTFATAQELIAARAGNPIALAKVRNAYDASLNLNFYVGENVAKQLGKGKEYGYIVKQEDLIKKKIKEQSPKSPSELMVSGNILGQEQLEKYPTLYGSPGFKQMVEESESGALMRMMNKSDLPPHLRQAITQGEPVFAQTSSVRGVFDITELRDYLLTRNPNDIKNMGVADAIAKSKQWHARMEAARRDPSKFSPKQLFEGTKEMLPTAGDMKWVDVRTPDALSLEGNIMGHCVGGSNYCNAVAKETTKIVSLRDKKGVPHVTIEIQKDRDGKFSRISQIKGTGNNSPEKYFTQVDDFLKDYSAKLGGDLSITERPNYVPPDWRYK